MPKTLGGLRQRHRKVATATTLTHYGFYVPEGERWFIAMAAFYADTTNNSDLVIGIEGPGGNHMLASQLNQVTGLWYNKQIQVWLYPHERLVFTWADVANTEVCEVDITGHIQELPKCD